MAGTGGAHGRALTLKRMYCQYGVEPMVKLPRVGCMLARASASPVLRKGDRGKLWSTTGFGRTDCPGWEGGFAEPWTVDVVGEGVIRGHGSTVRLATKKVVLNRPYWLRP